MEAGATLGPYKIGKRFGKGTSGLVHHGIHTGTNQEVALKFISYDPRTHISNPKTEIEILRQLEHPNIIRLYDMHEVEDEFILVFEYCKNKDLLKFIKAKFPENRVPEHQVQKIMQQICCGLKIVREKSIVHRDLKLENILVDHEYNLKIADFGSARVKESHKLLETYTGTKIYMSPEVLFWNSYGEKCDIWPLGIMIYQMLMGCFPYFPHPETEQDLLRAVEQFTEPPFPEGKISPMVRELLTLMLKKEPEQRIGFDALFNHPWISGVGFNPIITDDDGTTIELNSPNLWYPQTSPEFEKRYYKLVENYTISGDYFLKNLIYKTPTKVIYAGNDRLAGIEAAFYRIPKNVDKSIEEKLERELKALSMLNHDNIIKLIEYCTCESDHYMIMEMCSNGNLQEFIKSRFAEGYVPEFQAYLLFKVLIEAMIEIKEKKILHRNFTLENILIDEEYAPKISGFGYSIHLDNPKQPLEVPQRFTAPPEYLSDEQKSQIKIDVWSLGVIFHQILTGMYPFNSGVRSFEEITDLSTIYIQRDRMSSCVEDLISKMLVKDPSERITLEEIKTHVWFTKMGSLKHKYGTLVSKMTQTNWFTSTWTELKTAYELRVKEVGRDWHYLTWESIDEDCSSKLVEVQEVLEEDKIILNAKYEDGSQYFGEIKDGKREGQGKMVFKSGAEYIGTWKNDQMEGEGIFKWPSGAYHKGSFANNARNGEGEYTHPNGSKFSGTCKNDLINGIETYIWANGRVYKGEWADNVEHGEGISTFSNGDQYKGQWVNGKMQGKGEYHSAGPTKSVYIGDWIEGKKQGNGQLEFENGEKYVGLYRNDKRNGKGTYYWPNNQIYVGEWLDDKKHGIGELKCPKGEKYNGEWANDRMEGLGHLKWPDGGKYVGYFSNVEFKDHEHFTGEFIGLNGKKYSGEWKNLRMHGKGEYLGPEGTRFVGQSVEGKIDGKGVTQYANGETYEGDWKDNNPHGYGEYNWPDGRKYIGQFRDGNPMPDGTMKKDKNPEHDAIEYIWPYWKWTNKMQNGFATVKLEGGEIYEGFWKNGKRDGKGTCTWPNEERKYVGDWVQDRQEGRGEMTWANGRKYKGEWLNNQPHGRGEYLYPDKSKYMGDWFQGKKHGFGKMKYDNKDEYTGNWKNDLRHGKGKYTWKDGRVDKCEWVEDKQEGVGQSYIPQGAKKLERVWKSGVIISEKQIN